MPQIDARSLRDLTRAAALPSRRIVADAVASVPLITAVTQSPFDRPLSVFSGRTVLISSIRQLPAVLALLQLDGIARRVLLCPTDLAPEHIPAVIEEAGVDLVVSDGTGPAGHIQHGLPVATIGTDFAAAESVDHRFVTEWLLFTSGTTGRPKIVVHTLASLTGPLDDGLVVQPDAVWSTFYDVRRYGGLQILLRGLLGGGSMVLSQAGEPVADFIRRVGRNGVTHISGTPSHWRRALMSPAVREMAPHYVRLSGEVADQAILNALGAAFPASDIAHAFASTEAGVAFDVRDRLAGFPASLIGQTGGKAEMRVIDGSLRIRSSRTASCYLGAHGRLGDDDGFVDTGDMLERRGDRYYFVGRREGIVNVGGQKVHPEEVEAVINQHPAVQMARVRGRPSRITGAIVVADIVVRPEADGSFATIQQEIFDVCRRTLPPHKVPAMISRVEALEVGAAGKLVRRA